MTDIVSLLGDEAHCLLGHYFTAISQELPHPPGSDHVNRVIAP